jgi:hypothetical protein
MHHFGSTCGRCVCYGGIDIPITKSFQFRPVEIDYMRTRFTNQFNDSAQSNFRYSAGVNFTFGGSSK